MRFVADAMLGKLAKSLRLLGYDVLYDPSYDDNEIIHLSLEQNRIILTRDTGLVNRPIAKNHLFIASDDPGEQIRPVIDAFCLSPGQDVLTRCSVCNALLLQVDKEVVRNKIPEFVYRSKNNFLQCRECERIYWRGSHMRETTTWTK